MKLTFTRWTPVQNRCPAKYGVNTPSTIVNVKYTDANRNQRKIHRAKRQNFPNKPTNNTTNSQAERERNKDTCPFYPRWWSWWSVAHLYSRIMLFSGAKPTQALSMFSSIALCFASAFTTGVPGGTCSKKVLCKGRVRENSVINLRVKTILQEEPWWGSLGWWQLGGRSGTCPAKSF